MNVAEWQRRLENNFTVKGIVGGHLRVVHDNERLCEDYFVQHYHGQSVLIDSFQSFYIETINIARKYIEANGWPKGKQHYAISLLYFVVAFRRFRAAENLLLMGYPLDGYSLLRDLKDRAIILGAIARNISTFPLVFGYSGVNILSEDVRKQWKINREKEERRILNIMIRKQSGIPEDILKDLNKWEHLFHEEVHGSRLSLFSEMGDLVEGRSKLNVGPIPKDDHMAMYMNRVCETAWLFTRLFPFLQVSPNAFGMEWHRKLDILDDSFRIMQIGLDKIGKRIGAAFIYFVENKFSFNKPFFYAETNE
jgi:hypothetical protein